jgi:hypothetical protein
VNILSGGSKTVNTQLSIGINVTLGDGNHDVVHDQSGLDDTSTVGNRHCVPETCQAGAVKVDRNRKPKPGFRSLSEMSDGM